MGTIKEAKEQGVQATAGLIEAFRDRLAASRSSLPSIRCLSHSRLAELVLETRKQIDSAFLRE